MTVLEHWAWTLEMRWIIITRSTSCHWVASTMIVTGPLVSLRNQNVLLSPCHRGAVQGDGRLAWSQVAGSNPSLSYSKASPSFHSGTPSCPAVLKLSIVSQSCVHKYVLQNSNNKANMVLSESGNRYQQESPVPQPQLQSPAGRRGEAGLWFAVPCGGARLESQEESQGSPLAGPSRLHRQSSLGM